MSRRTAVPFRAALSCFACISLLLCPQTDIAGEREKRYVCYRLAARPRIDGVVRREEWNGTVEGSDLAMSLTEALPRVRTSFRIGCDAARLYFAIVCEETNPQGIVAKTTQRDGCVWTDDCVELALDTAHDHGVLTKFIVNSLGTLSDMSGGALSWNAAVEVAACRGDGFWSVELAVPFAELQRKAPGAGEVWGLNVFRQRYTTGKQELINWAEAYGVFTMPTHVGHIVFAGADRRIPRLGKLHEGLEPAPTPELARHPAFEGRPWSITEVGLAQEQDLRSTFQTPHVDMAGPLKTAPIRALAFIRIDSYDALSAVGTRVRDFAELAQRFPVETTGVFVTSNGLWGGQSGERRLKAILQDTYDAFIFSRCTPDDVPADAAAQIADRVAHGTGILFYGASRDWLGARGRAAGAASALAQAFPIEDLSHYSALSRAGVTGVTSGAYPLIATYQIGKGRAVSIQNRGDAHCLTPSLGFSRENFVDYEYWIGLTGTALMWGAAQQAVRLTCGGPGEVQFGRMPVSVRVSVRWEHNITGDLGIEAFIRDEDGIRRKVFGKYFGAAGSLDLNVPIPRLSYGRYLIEARAWRGKKVEAFAAARLIVTGPDHVPGFELSSDFFERGTSVTGTLECVGLNGKRIRTELVTDDGRVLARKDLGPLQDGPAPFSFTVPGDTTILMRARVSVLDGKMVVQAKSVEFRVPDRKRDTFNFIMWDCPVDVLAPAAMESMARAGFNVDLRWDMHQAISASGFSFMPYTTRITATRDGTGVMSPGCWNDEAFISKHVGTIAEKQLPARKHGVFAYSLGDENDTAGCCLHPACLAAYREFLKVRYGSIDALNKSWGEEYSSFDEVQMMQGDDLFTDSAAFRAGRYPRWLDRSVFARLNYTRLCARFARKYLEIDPQAITGFEGAGRFTDDPDAIYDAVGMWTTYGSVIDELIRVTKPQELIHGNWIGYSKDASTLVAVAWRSLCTGANSIWWWRWEGIGTYRGFLRPTLDLWPATQELAQEMQVVRDGLGRLLMDAQPEHDGVALFYSVESALADQLPAASQFGVGEVAQSGAVHMLKDAAIQFTYVTPRRIASGALNGIKVLLLPKTLALDAGTAGAIREFVRSGGTLIADVWPAIYDEHLKALDRSLLDNVFAARSFGKGRALLLGYSFGEYEAARNQPKAVSLRQPVVEECLESGVVRRALVEPADGEPNLMTEFSTWKLGSASIAALRRDLYTSDWALSCPPAPRDTRLVRIDLARPAVVYDLRAGRCLGKVSSFSASLRTGYANFYGLFDKPIPKPAVTVSARPDQGAARLRATVSIPGADTAVRLRLIDPSGKAHRWSVRVVRVIDGSAAAYWQIPADQPGRWTVEARELFTCALVRRPVLITIPQG